MKDLIKITKSNINGSEINSVNAREIHEYLEVKTAFSHWINRAIEKYDFIENIDFVKIDKPLNNQKDYIVSLDMAKELSMVENNPKGKETRKYFIEVEKQQNRVLTISEQIALIAQGHQEVEQRISTIEQKIDNDITLTSAQKHHLKKIVTNKAFELKKTHNLDDSFNKKSFQRIWKKLKDYFVVSSYMEIPKVRFDEACNIVNNTTIGDLI